MAAFVFGLVYKLVWFVDLEGLLSFGVFFHFFKLISKDSRQAFEKRSQLIIEDLSGKKHFRYAFSTEDKSSQ